MKQQRSDIQLQFCFSAYLFWDIAQLKLYIVSYYVYKRRLYIKYSVESLEYSLKCLLQSSLFFLIFIIKSVGKFLSLSVNADQVIDKGLKSLSVKRFKFNHTATVSHSSLLRIAVSCKKIRPDDHLYASFYFSHQIEQKL